MNDHDFENGTIVVQCLALVRRLVFTKVSLENAKSEKNEHSS